VTVTHLPIAFVATVLLLLIIWGGKTNCAIYTRKKTTEWQ